MEKYFSALNGFGYDKSGNNRHLLNAHFSYKGRSVIIDYEKYLYDYGLSVFKDKDNKDLIPFGMYPYGDDVYIGYVPMDERFKKADMVEIIKQIEDALYNEP